MSNFGGTKHYITDMPVAAQDADVCWCCGCGSGDNHSTTRQWHISGLIRARWGRNRHGNLLALLFGGECLRNDSIRPPEVTHTKGENVLFYKEQAALFQVINPRSLLSSHKFCFEMPSKCPDEGSLAVVDAVSVDIEFSLGFDETVGIVLHCHSLVAKLVCLNHC